MNALLENEFASFTSLYGIACILGGVIYKLFPPKKMTWYSGVQLKVAKQNTETWKEANQFMSTPAIIIGTLFIALACLSFVFENSTIFTYRSASILIFTSFIILYHLLHKHLNKLFDKSGNRIQNA